MSLHDATPTPRIEPPALAGGPSDVRARRPSSRSTSAPRPGWALRAPDGLITSGTVSFRPSRYDGGGMRYLRFTNWLTELDQLSGPIAAIWYEEVRRHVGTDAAHVYGGLMATLTAWAELRGVPYQGVPVGTIKIHATGKGNAAKEAMIAAARARGFSPSRRQRGRRASPSCTGRSTPAEVCGDRAADPRAHGRRRGRSVARPTARPTRSWRRSPRAGR